MIVYHEIMTKPPARRSPRVAEPVQVYLDPADQDRLERLARELDATKSDVLRQGLAALEALRREVVDPECQAPLPTFTGKGLRPGVSLDSNAALLDLMDGQDAAR